MQSLKVYWKEGLALKHCSFLENSDDSQLHFDLVLLHYLTPFKIIQSRFSNYHYHLLLHSFK